MYVDVTDETFQADVLERSSRPRGRRPVGRVVRALPHARADHREGDRRDRRRRSRSSRSNVDENPRHRQAFQVQSIPRGLRPQGRQDRSTASSAHSPRPRSATSCRAPRRSRNRPIERLIVAGDEDSLRQALDLEADNAEAVIGAGGGLLVERARPRRRSACWPASPRLPRPDGSRRWRALGDVASDDRRLRRGARRAARPGPRRRRCPPAVRRPARAARARRPAYRGATARP